MSIEIKRKEKTDELPNAFHPAIEGLNKVEYFAARILPGLLYRRRNIGNKALTSMAVELALDLLDRIQEEYNREVLGEITEDDQVYEVEDLDDEVDDD